MKKLILLIVTLLSFAAIATAQNPFLIVQPDGDATPCKNEKQVMYYLRHPGMFTSSYIWYAPPAASLTDGVKNAAAGQPLYTDSTRIFVNYKTKSGNITVYPVSSSGVVGAFVGRQISLSCLPGFGYTVPTDDPAAPSGPDTTLQSVVITPTSNTSFTPIFINFTHLACATDGYIVFRISDAFNYTPGLYDPVTNTYWKQVTGSLPTPPFYSVGYLNPFLRGVPNTIRILIRGNCGTSGWSAPITFTLPSL